MAKWEAELELHPDFSGATVVVTGGAQGIGAAVVEAFVAAGARVAVIDLQLGSSMDPPPLNGTNVLALIADVSDRAAVEASVAAVRDWSGTIDVLINNAGITRDAIVWKMSDDDWRQVLDVHLTGTFNMTRAVLPVMRASGRGRVINVTSYSGLRGNIGQANYAAAKAGVIGFTKTVAKEVARFNITVNAISPNALTAMVDAIPTEKRAALERDIPMQRFGEPREMVGAVMFLASNDAAYITGAVLPVDGGLSV